MLEFTKFILLYLVRKHTQRNAHAHIQCIYPYDLKHTCMYARIMCTNMHYLKYWLHGTCYTACKCKEGETIEKLWQYLHIPFVGALIKVAKIISL